MDSNLVNLGVVGTLALGGAFWAAGKFGPGMLVSKLHQGFEDLKDSAWVRDAAHPKRAQWLAATAALFEDEIPNPGTGKDFYAKVGAGVSARLLVGSAEQWAKVAEQFGDAVDLELDEDVKALAGDAPKQG